MPQSSSNFMGLLETLLTQEKIFLSHQKTYQMDFANITEASLEIKLDINEGADMV